jgi:hypothetical protein
MRPYNSSDENSRLRCLFVDDDGDDGGGSSVQRVRKRNVGVSNSDALTPGLPERGRRGSLQPVALTVTQPAAQPAVRPAGAMQHGV